LLSDLDLGVIDTFWQKKNIVSNADIINLSFQASTTVGLLLPFQPQEHMAKNYIDLPGQAGLEGRPSLRFVDGKL
jgi:hypothetical protein